MSLKFSLPIDLSRSFPSFSHLAIIIEMSDTETVDGGRTSPTHGGRHEKSLGLLTSKFVDLLQAAEGGVLDLKKVCTSLDFFYKHI